MAELTSGTSDQGGTPREGSAHDPATASSPQGVDTAQLRLVDLDKTYPGGHHALRGVSLDVADGEVVVIIGPSGCGKSTLLRTINGLEPINSGRIILDGTDLAAPGVSWPEVRRRIGMVFQSYELFPHLSVMGNLTLAPGLVAGETRGDASARALKLLERVGLADRADDYPRQLSGGQRQRVAIVRALMMNPEILLLDEVTASLDPEMVREVLDVVLELARTGMTMLIVTHEMGFARAIADRIVFMDEGRIVEVDPPRKFFADPSSDRARKFLDIFSFEGAKL
ncbi:MAG: amino acid ABC transporter ATP-binding protein [Pauljensenia sp.]|uniref:amino acid ABC transporter ATP-binding protein n=1 Tax=Actinomyces sp. oral taxon 180 TaxID=651609 RepID=UPI0001F15A85|nr:amino acid ABC transporter ATP-binding protein [Actinomyces sp. oral taxon 180]EFU61027.1 amino acid ABC superfamily ATP binding cassette transporter, ABC protein [Actinomyces sp. oral taxon 180 str. F0310]